MSGWIPLLLPNALMYAVWQLPPTIAEIHCYYHRGGLVQYDHRDKHDTWNANIMAIRDAMIYYKRFLDRPKSQAAKAFYSYLDWSAPVQDRTLYIWRRNLSRGYDGISKLRLYVYGPFVFNWPCHSTQWLRGDDAASLKKPAWGEGGKERAVEEYNAAKEKCLDKHWHYHCKRLVRQQQEKKAENEKIAAMGKV